MGGNVSKKSQIRGSGGTDREVYARLPYSGTAARERPSTERTTSLRGRGTAKVTRTAQTKQPGQEPKESRKSKPATRPWTPGPHGASPSPHSTTFTVSTADSAHRHDVRDSSSSSVASNDIVDSPPPSSRVTNPHRRMSDHPSHAPSRHSLQQQFLTEEERRIAEAEKILGDIAKEYAAKRAAGLVPTKPVPARTLLWEELAKKSTQAGRRGQCIFGRDTDNICGCTTYKKKRVPGEENTGGVCECCQHGAVWHRLVGGTMARSSRMSRSILGGGSTVGSNTSGLRASRLESATSDALSEARSSAYDYDSDEDEDDEDEEAIANEMAMPSTFYPVQPSSPHASQANDGSSRGGLDRLSMLSIGSSYGFPSRLSSATNSLGALLQAIQRYRDMGLDEDEIEARIRSDFPPVPRKSSVAARSDVDVSQSPVDV